MKSNSDNKAFLPAPATDHGPCPEFQFAPKLREIPSDNGLFPDRALIKKRRKI